jgi:serine/threonine protein kinase
MSSSSRDSISNAAEDLFFANLHLSSEEWEGCLAAGSVGSVGLTDQLREEVEELVGQLANVRRTEQLGETGAADSEEPLNLHVPGRQGSQYELVRRLGTGGHSTVYEAIQREPFQRPVAVKVYYASSTSSDSLGELREIQALTRLQHPGICQVLDAGVTPWQQPFLALELIVGSPLDRHIAEQNLGFDQRLSLVTEVAEIIGVAHSQGVVHRDLKPQNILVHAASGRVKLIDFSIAGISDPTATARVSSTAAGYGTRSYQSPEQAGLIRYPVDHRSDLYSLGCVLFEVLTGDPAFPAEAADLRFRAITDERRRQAALRASLSSRLLERLNDLFDGVPLSQRQAIAAVIERCVEETPDERLQSAAKLKQHLDSVTAGLPVELPPAPAARRRRLKQLAALAVVAGCLVAVLATTTVDWGNARAPASEQPRAAPRNNAVARAARLFDIISQRATDPGFTNPAADDSGSREAWLQNVSDELARMPDAIRLDTARWLLDLCVDAEYFEIAGRIARHLEGYLGSSQEDLLLRGELLDIQLTQDVTGREAQAAKEKGAALVQQMEQAGLLTTTPQGLMVLARYTHLLLDATTPSEREEAGRLLGPLAREPERILAVDRKAAEQVLLVAMYLQLVSGNPAAVLEISDTFTQGGLAEPNAPTDIVARWAKSTTEALLRTGKPQEAVALAQKVLNQHSDLSRGRRNELLLFIASVHEGENRVEEAVDVLTPLITDEQPGKTIDAHWMFMTHMQAGRCHVKLKQFEEGVLLLQRAAEIMNQWPSAVPVDGHVFAWVWLAEANEGRGNRKAAQAAFSTALTNLQDACDTGRLPEEMRAGVGDQLESRIARLEKVE